MASWAEVVAFSQPLDDPGGGGGGRAGENDREITYGVAHKLPVIHLDAETGARRVTMMRWGFPDRRDPRRAQPIHARSETVDEKFPFRNPFAAGRRGIVVFRTFNEGEVVPTRTGGEKTVQWTVDPQDGLPRGFAFVWDSFDVAGMDSPMLACVMVTVPANRLLRETVLQNDPEPRMPAILRDEDWSAWLGEGGASPADAKAALRTMEGVSWKVAPEPRKPRRPRP